MIDTSGIDIKAVIDQMACIAWKKPVRSRGEMVYKGGPCPFCGQGTDRFAVFPEGEKPHFYCGIHGNGCGAHGDAISFVQRLRGYASAYQAIGELQEMGFEVGDKGRVYTKTLHAERGMPSQTWQEKGDALVHASQKYLWSSVGSPAREYLRKRGLTDETIKRFRLGYWPKWMEYTLVSWGLANASGEEEATFWIRPGIIIPWYKGDALWKINQRITEYTSKEREFMAQGKALPRYKAVKGSGNGLFNVDAILPGQPCVLTEGEFCAMTLAQETDCVAVATGSTTGARVSRWVAALSLASHLLIAFDNDQGKGESAATYWLDVFEDKASLWLPWAKDINDMLQEGMDIAVWVALGRQLASNAKSVPIEENRRDHSRENVVPAQSAIETDGSLCSTCLDEDRETPADGEYDGIMYCSKHLPAYPQLSQDEIVERFRQEVAHFFNGCTVHRDPLGCTLSEHIKVLD